MKSTSIKPMTKEERQRAKEREASNGTDTSED